VVLFGDVVASGEVVGIVGDALGLFGEVLGTLDGEVGVTVVLFG
jgi:hypothetical protein